jgi:hypothetical protein
MPLSDHRAEVAALAMDLWIREEFGLPPIDVEVRSSAADGRYTFLWGATEDPFSDQQV